MTRTKTRELLMQLLFQMEVQKDYSNRFRDKYMELYFQENSQKDYAFQLINAVLENLDAIDRKLNENSKTRSTERMAKVDLAIVRLALGEVFYMDGIPGAVTINEAVEMAKKYSTDESRKFINGLLGQIVNNKDE